MGGGDFQPGFPHPNPTESYWQLPSHAISNHRTTAELPTSTAFDYIIVGSGISGAAVAHKLLSRDASLSILIVEARTAASGASGRNGGHYRPGWWFNFKRYHETFGEDEAVRFARLEEQNVRDIADFVGNHQVICDFQDVETADVYFTHEAWAKALEVKSLRENVLKTRQSATDRWVKHETHNGAAAQSYIGIPGIVGAVTYPAHTQNPYLLVCHMLQMSLDKGLNLQTNTTVTRVAKVHDKWNVQTDRGTVQASRVILATNGYTNALHPGLAATEFLTPARAQVAAVRPGSTIDGSPAETERGPRGHAHGGLLHVPSTWPQGRRRRAIPLSVRRRPLCIRPIYPSI
ncbi:FAD dependent oxidoreductase-domain-containing protein [Stachybotrys elegans]|uniref:FAD dependent oxidoreductase-domain-containing protein n=1 Tax=Stachybotrys elegans TaxID=80388 RepID=A0A8K0S7W9_9HYPO|nr:FAD dependent oxidoreductase-domain-containing protein [Stachybotrys elegans]